MRTLVLPTGNNANKKKEVVFKHDPQQIFLQRKKM